MNQEEIDKQIKDMQDFNELELEKFMSRNKNIDIDKLGKILSYTKLNYKCNDCDDRADITIGRSNDELPDGYNKSGKRCLNYCMKCLPTDAREEWGKMSDMKYWF